MDLDLSKASEVQDATPIKFSVLALINQARNEHGMRQQNFKRYREYCTAKVYRLRETLNKTHTADRKNSGKKKSAKGAGQKGLSKKAKRKAQSATVQSEAAKGKGNVFVRKTISIDEVKDDRPAQYFLFEAERAWSYGQELKQLSFAKEQDGSLRRQGLARTRRAIQFAKQLLDLIKALGSTRTDVISHVEAEAYHTLIRGYEAFDKDDHATSLELLSVARKLLYLIAEASTDSRQEALANTFVDGTDAMLRFCAYSMEISEQNMDTLGEAAATPEACTNAVPDFNEYEKELKAKAQNASATKGQGNRLDEIEWRGKSMPVRNPDLVEVITKARTAEDDLRASLKKANAGEEVKVKATREHKRQRLTSAQRSAKRRGQTVAVASSADKAIVADNAAGSSKVRTELDGYDGLLAALTEAEEVARRLVKDNAEALSKSHSGRYEATSTTLVNVHEYVLFKLIATRIERNAALISEVQEKSAKRQARTREYVEGRINALTTSNVKKARAEGKEPVRRRAKPSSKKVRPPTARKVRQKRATSTKRRIGNKSSSRVRPAEQRLRSRGEQKIRRIAVRTIPGSARLLDANEAGCATMSGLSVVEADSDLSTLIEAKSAWYKAEMLRMLARSFAASEEHAKGLVLLNRAELFVREAQSAMELVNSEAVHEEDSTLLPPQMDETTFSRTSDEIARLRRQIQRELYVKQQGTSAAKTVEISNKKAGASQSKAAQAVRDLASKYVAFDPVDLRQAAVIPDDVIQDVSSTSLPASRRPSAVPKSKTGVPTPIAVPAAPAAPAAPTSPASPDDAEGEAAFVEAESMPSPDEDHMSDAEDDVEFADASAKDVDGDGAYDPGNMLAEEEEREAADAAAKKGRWLGGWFARN